MSQNRKPSAEGMSRAEALFRVSVVAAGVFFVWVSTWDVTPVIRYFSFFAGLGTVGAALAWRR